MYALYENFSFPGYMVRRGCPGRESVVEEQWGKPTASRVVQSSALSNRPKESLCSRVVQMHAAHPRDELIPRIVQTFETWSHPALSDRDVLIKRKHVIRFTTAQIALTVSLNAIGAIRKIRAFLFLTPFFVASAVLGYLGAKRANKFLVAAHFIGSFGLATVLSTFIIATATLKRDSTDLFFFALNAPMDAFIFISSIFSFRLYSALSQLQRNLQTQRSRMLQERREQTRVMEEALAAGADIDQTLRREARAIAAERRRVRASGGYESVEGTHMSSLLRDLRCPISLEIMSDPVIASDGHSYEREAITRWLSFRRTSPMTGAILTSDRLVPNHRLRALIDHLRDTILMQQPGGPAPAALEHESDNELGLD